MKITKTQLKQIIKEEVSDACGNLSEIKGHASPENLRKYFGPETLEKTGIKRSSDQDLEMQLRDETEEQLIEILKGTLEDARYALDSHGAVGSMPGIIQNLETALAILEGGEV